MSKLKSVEHVWTIVCSRSSVDSELNNISLFNLIEKLTFTIPEAAANQFAASGKRGMIFPAEFEVVSRFYRRDTKRAGMFDMRINLKNDKGEIIFKGNEQKIALKEGIDNLRVRNQFKNIPVEKTGEYRIAIEIKEVEDQTYTEVWTLPISLVIEISKKGA